MGTRIFTNIDAIDANRHLGITAGQLSKTIQRLSSGLRINSAADDAAGLAISQRLDAQVRGDNQAVRNVQDGISMYQTAEGALDEVHAMFQRLRELSVQAANGTLSTNDVNSINAEIQQLGNSIDQIANTTQFNGNILMNGSFQVASGGLLTLQIGANANSVYQGVAITYQSGVVMQNMTSAGISTGFTVNGTWLSANGLVAVLAGTLGWVGAVGGATAAAVTQANANIYVIDQAIDIVSAFRGQLGAKQNALEHTMASLNVASENQAAAESRIKDLDVANETVQFTKLQILQQAGTAVLAQANVAPQSVLQLLK
jgi:flagellin